MFILSMYDEYLNIEIPPAIVPCPHLVLVENDSNLNFSEVWLPVVKLIGGLLSVLHMKGIQPRPPPFLLEAAILNLNFISVLVC